MSYVLLKNIHLTCVLLTFASFTLRFTWMLLNSGHLQAKVTRIMPHIIDTTLLVSAIGLAARLQQYPMSDSWLTAKVGGLIVYIFAGTVALKRGKTKKRRIAAGVIAYCTFAYIVMVAFLKKPLVMG